MLSNLPEVNRFDQAGPQSLTSGPIVGYPNRFRTQAKGDRGSGDRSRIGWRSDQKSMLAEMAPQPFVSARKPTSQKIGLPDELCDEPVAGVSVDFRWCADLKDFAFVQNGDPVCDRERLLLVVGHVDGSQLKLPADAADFLPHFQTKFRIQIGQRLIQEQT